MFCPPGKALSANSLLVKLQLPHPGQPERRNTRGSQGINGIVCHQGHVDYCNCLEKIRHADIPTIWKADRSLVTPEIPSLVAVTNVMLKFRHL